MLEKTKNEELYLIFKTLINLNNNTMKDEMTRQCEMAWGRGFKAGLLIGVIGLIVGLVIGFFIGGFFVFLLT